MQLQTLQQNQRNLTLGLLWGGVMLAILACWIAVAHRDAPYIVVVLLSLLALAAFGFAVAQVMPRKKDVAESLQLEQLHRQRRLVGKILLAAGAALILIAAWLAIWFGLASIGTSLGLLVLGLIAAGAGWVQLALVGRQVNQQEIFQGLGKQGLLASLARFLFGGRDSADGVRLLILVLGGTIGFLLTLTAILWAWVWRSDVLFGGLTAWRGDQSWKLWLCAYTSLLGLAVMFASLALARFDIRADPVFRRVLYGYNTILLGLLLFEFLVVLNIVVYVLFPMNFHWSESRGFYTLSPSAKDILQKLDKPAKLYVMLSHPLLEKDTRNFIDNAQSVTDKLHVTYISPDKENRAIDDLAARYQEILSVGGSMRRLGYGILVVYGDEPPSAKDEQAPHTMIGVEKIFDYRSDPRSGAGSYVFKGEEVLMSEIRFLAEGRSKSKIYFLQGDGELNLGPDRIPVARPAHLKMETLGIGRLFDRLKKENYEVRGLSFADGKSDENIEHVQPGKGGKKDIPQDARALVIAGPSEELSKDTVEALDRYMKDRKGRLLVLMDMVVKVDQQRKKIDGIVTTGLETPLQEYGVDITDDYVHQLPPLERTSQGIVVRGDALRVNATVAKNDTVLASKFLGQEFELKSARIVKPGKKAEFKCETLLQVIPEEQDNGLIWAENDYRGLYGGLEHSRDLLESGQLQTRRSKEPLSVAVTVTEANGTPRMVVIGDAELASDREIVGRNGTVNFNFLTSALDWLADRPGIGIRPKEAGVYQYPQEVSPSRMVLLPAWFMMLAVVGLGVGVWVVRRR